MGRSLQRLEASIGVRRAAQGQERWNIWLIRAVVVAAHGVFVVLPIFAIGVIPQVADVEYIDIFALEGYGGIVELTDADGTTTLPTTEEIEVALEEAAAAGEEAPQYFDGAETIGAWSPAAGERVASVEPEVVGNSTGTVTFLQNAKVLLEEFTVVTPEVTENFVRLNWPQIRNPTIMRRFLRSRYNPLYENPGERGTVSVSVAIDERGSVTYATIKESSGYPSLDEIAVALFQEVATFAPARRGRTTVPVEVTISVPFQVPW